jgi:hypothetical protein
VNAVSKAGRVTWVQLVPIRRLPDPKVCKVLLAQLANVVPKALLEQQ